RTALLLTCLAAALAAGCASDPTFAVERRRPPALPLPGARRLAVIAFVGSGGDLVASALASRLAKDGEFALCPDARPFEAAREASGEDDDRTLARLAERHGQDGVLTGRVSAFEVGPVLAAPTLVTKSTPAGPKDVATVRRSRTARLAVSFRVVLA